MKPEKKIVLFTYMFPYGNSEAFLESELPLLAQKYDRIALVPMVSGKGIRPLPANVEIIDMGDLNSPALYVNRLRNIPLLLAAFVTEFLLSKRRWTYLAKGRYFLNYLSHKKNLADLIDSKLQKQGFGQASCYSYWFDYWILPLCLLKREHKISYLLTRAHGGDVYEYQHIEKDYFFPFRTFQIKYIDRICPISENSLSHLQEKYPVSSAKLRLSRLGVNEARLGPLPLPESIPTIVSCSTFMHYKCVHRIPEILKNLNCRVKWIHIGSEGDMEMEVRKAVELLPSTVEVSFIGQLSNKEVLAFYASTPLTMFLNVSRSEGLPVSMMEAISFGIPVVGTDVGGVKEIVNSQTGFLLERDFDSEQAAAAIKTHFQQFSEAPFREGVRQFWASRFNANLNYQEFIDCVLPA
jgi:glycosyltransferase involved in cell wall biosynthesis